MDIQHKLDEALNLKAFMAEAEAKFKKIYESDEGTSSENEYQQKRPTFEEKNLIYNKSVDDERKWLYNVLMSDTESDSSEISDEDRYVGEMLKDYVHEKKLREKYHQNPTVSRRFNGNLFSKKYIKL